MALFLGFALRSARTVYVSVNVTRADDRGVATGAEDRAAWRQAEGLRSLSVQRLRDQGKRLTEIVTAVSKSSVGNSCERDGGRTG